MSAKYHSPWCDRNHGGPECNCEFSDPSTANSIGQQCCPHCGGLHFGQRFDDCPYVKLITDSSSTEEQLTNARGWLAQRGGAK